MFFPNRRFRFIQRVLQLLGVDSYTALLVSMSLSGTNGKQYEPDLLVVHPETLRSVLDDIELYTANESKGLESEVGDNRSDNIFSD